MKKLSLLLLLICFSCSHTPLTFAVKNTSGEKYDSVVITGLGKVKIENMKDNSSVTKRMDFSNSKTSTDGSYQIKLFNKNEMRQQTFGYYSNGYPLTLIYGIIIQKDTIDVIEISDELTSN